MNRKSRNLLISLAVLVLAAGSLLLVRTGENSPEEDSREPMVQIGFLSEVPAESLRSVRIENPEGGFHLYSPDGQNWLVEGVSDSYRPDTAGINTAVRYLSRIQGQVVEESANPDRLREFGLDHPEIRLTLRNREGDTTVVEFGAESPTGSGRFARQPDSGTVILVSPVITRTVKSVPDSFRDRSLPTVNLQEMIAFSYKSGDTVFIAEPRTEDDPYRGSLGPFEVVSPFRGRYPLADHVLSELLTETSPLPTTVSAWRDDVDPEDPSWGLGEDEADRIYIADRSGGILSLLLGIPDGMGNRYARLGDRDEAVFLVPETALGLLETPPFELIDKFVCLASISNVSSVRVEASGRNWVMTRFPYGDEDSVKDDRFNINNLPAEQEDFSDVYKKLIGIMWEGQIEERKTLESPEVRITLSHVDPGVKDVIIRFWDYNEVYYQASVDESPLEFLVGRYQVQDVIDDLAALAEFAS